MNERTQESLDDVVSRIGVSDAERLLALDLWTIAGRNALMTSIGRAKEAAAVGQIDLTLGDARVRPLQGEIDRGELKLLVSVCPDCGLRRGEQAVKNRAFPPRCFECNGVAESEQTLMDGKPMIPLEIPVRKLPQAFKHLDSSLRTGITERYIAKLVREIDQQRQATVPVREAGGHAHNARIILRFAAERAGASLTAGAIRVRGDGEDARVTFFVDASEGVGNQAMT